LLLFKDQNVLLLCYGVSEENDPRKKWRAVGDAPTVTRWFQEKFARAPDRYGASFVKAAYDLRKALPIAELNRELDLMIDQYRGGMGLGDEREPVPFPRVSDFPIQVDLKRSVQLFADALKACFVNFGSAHDKMCAAFVCSLVTKPLVILTGLSGSGKTQLAIRFGEWLGKDRLHVAAVRPDWTGAESLFGYEDGLKEAKNGRAAWNVPPALEFMLRAAGDPEHPYLLVLDEMNLAHVERYFADVLSGMESRQECLPNLIKEEDGIWRVPQRALHRIEFPENLWVVGTVNVDETTYMFSPKVLDRANTFEFRVGATDLSPNARKPVRCASGDSAVVRGLLKLSTDHTWQEKNPPAFKTQLERLLRQLHEALARNNLEFGHRVFYEALRFGALAERSGLGGLEETLDRLVIQKVLPRLHGSRRRLEISILALMHFCRDLPEVIETDEKLPALNIELETVAPKLPSSYDKLSRMLKSLRANQFVSFTE
jgi:5-methylcytosine-specific restriction protein B